MKHIKTWSERCEEHPDHQQGMISERMISERMQEEIDELREALDADKAHALLRWAETEMRYAGWDTRLNDQHGRTNVYEAIKEFLA